MKSKKLFGWYKSLQSEYQLIFLGEKINNKKNWITWILKTKIHAMMFLFLLERLLATNDAISKVVYF